jgi:D-alanyl-lipoteichoic acid acyltransferase DltB (MBOAT superfamily)
MANLFASQTPAMFWRRWNRPAQQFFHEYAFKPAGGQRWPVRSTLMTFAVSGLVHEYVFGITAGYFHGWQMAFFMLQGCAVAATMRTRPSRNVLSLWVAATLAFNLAASVLFFKSIDAVLPFYAPRGT